MKKILKNLKFNPVMAIVALAGLVVFALLVCGGVESVYTLAAFTPCLGVISDNMSQDCNNPRVAGYEDIALIINRSEIDWSAVTYDPTNKRIVKSLAMATGKTPYVVYNPRVNPAPFNGTNATFNADNNRYDKTVQCYYEGIGGAAALNVVEPLKAGSYVMLLQRKDHRGDGSFQLIGFESGLKATAQVQDEETGYWLMTMTTNEPSADVSLFDTDYATTKTAFDTLLALVP